MPNPFEPRPICLECGNVCNPKTAAVLHTLVGNEKWIASPDIVKGVYCSSDHLLNAYLRGWPAAGIERTPKKPIIRRRRS